MLRMTWFETEEELQSLTGLTHDELWEKGFDLDDWDFGIRVDRPLHGEPEEEDDAVDELYEDWNKEGHWLLGRMNEYCSGPRYVKLGRWHYYLVYHS